MKKYDRFLAFQDTKVYTVNDYEAVKVLFNNLF